MDINAIRIAVTLVSLGLFIALVLHTWSRSRKAEHEAAAQLPFMDDAGTPNAPARQGEDK
jgi:cytochrome c oxidase cbb3-type subunit 4